MKKLNIPEPHWIVDNQALQEICADWLRAPYIAVDTEFIRTKTFYPEAGLIQVADAQGCYLIDPLSITEWQPLIEVFTHPLVVKVFHACAEDLEVCRHLLGIFPAPLADTQLAAAYVGLGSSLGYQGLLQASLNVHLPKEETRSDWMQRPLTAKQISYAVADVHFLYKIYPKLLQRLKELDRLPWLHEDSNRLVKLAEEAEKPENYFSKIKQGWRLREQQLFLLKQLSLWRELQARQENVPRNYVVDSQVLWNMAHTKAASKEQMLRAGMSQQEFARYGKALLELTEQALKVESSAWPKQLNKPLSPEDSFRYRDLKNIVRQQAESLGVPAELLANKKSLETLLRSGFNNKPYKLPKSLEGWRLKHIGQPLLQFLESKVTYE